MKKLFFICLIAALCTVYAIAQDSVDLTKPATEIRFPDDFPKGQWTDSKWSATWEFGGNSIKLYKGSQLIKDFSGDVKDYTVNVGLNGIVVKFTCDSTKRTYQFTKPVSLTTDLEMIIDRHDTPASDPNTHYETNIKFKK